MRSPRRALTVAGLLIKAVNYRGERNTLLVQLQGTGVPEHAVATLHTIGAGLRDVASLETPNAIAPTSQPIHYAKDLSIDLGSYTVAVLDIRLD